MTEKTELTQQKIEENNLFLAHLLDGTIEEHYEDDRKYLWWAGELADKWRIEKLGKTGKNILASDLKFHQSWDWLMPVWEKFLLIANKAYNDVGTIIQVNIMRVSKAILSGQLDETYNLLVDMAKYMSQISYEIDLRDSPLIPSIDFISSPIVQITFQRY